MHKQKRMCEDRTMKCGLLFDEDDDDEVELLVAFPTNPGSQASPLCSRKALAQRAQLPPTPDNYQ